MVCVHQIYTTRNTLLHCQLGTAIVKSDSKQLAASPPRRAASCKVDKVSLQHNKAVSNLNLICLACQRQVCLFISSVLSDSSQVEAIP